MLAALAAYQPAWQGGPLWDDDAHLTPPTLASTGGLWRIWSDVTVSQQYYPVVSTAFWVMNRAWGHDPLGYHLVNILLHACSGFLVAGILRRWSVPGAMLAAVIFTLHPVHVESVAWMTELKNTLSGVFYLLAATAYLRFDETRRPAAYAAALGWFVLALGSKTVTASLPAALLVIFWWRHGRVDWRTHVRPLLPFFALGVIAGLGTAWIEVAWVGAKGDSFELTFVERGLLAGRAVWFYAGKVVWPVGLMFMYPRWSIDQSVAWQYVFPIALVMALGVLWAPRGRSRAPLAAALFFCGTLFPALGFVNVFPFRYSWVADHFQYLASLGVIVAVSSAVMYAVARWRPGVPEPVVAVAIAVPLFLLTFQQSGHYASAEILYRTTLASNPESQLARTNLSALLLDGPKEGWAEAADHAIEAIRISPGDGEAHSNLGLALHRVGRLAEAEAALREAIRLKPTLATAHYNLGLTLVSLGREAEAVEPYEASLRIFPRQPEVRRNLSNVLLKLGRADDAVAHLREAVALSPGTADIHMNLGNALQATGQFDAAIAAYRQALAIRPEWGEAYHNLALAQRRAARHSEAVESFLAAERLLPGAVPVLVGFANLLVSLGQLDEAVPRLQRAVLVIDEPRAAELHNDLGIVLARLGRFPEAIVQFEAALRIEPDFQAARANLNQARRR
jgi:tetratricopeptide (TPR) repeat protein